MNCSCPCGCANQVAFGICDSCKPVDAEPEIIKSVKIERICERCDSKFTPDYDEEICEDCISEDDDEKDWGDDDWDDEPDEDSGRDDR